MGLFFLAVSLVMENLEGYLPVGADGLIDFVRILYSTVIHIPHSIHNKRLSIQALLIIPTG